MGADAGPQVAGRVLSIAIIGAGIAGLACGTGLAAAGHSVVLFDKGRGAGGRMSSRRIAIGTGEVGFDHGAQYFTARNAGFLAQAERWSADGVVAPWPAAGADAWVGTPAMNAPVKALATGLDVRWGARVDSLWRDARGWRIQGYDIDAAADAVVVAIPAEQAALLLKRWHEGFSTAAAATPSAPCGTVLAAFAEPLPIAGDVLRDCGIIGWAARNSAKPGREGPEAWVIQAGPDWSAAHAEDDPADIERALIDAFAEASGTVPPEALGLAAHRWRYARSGAPPMLDPWDGAVRLGICGDWTSGPRVEAAWLSGRRLADAILRSDLS